MYENNDSLLVATEWCRRRGDAWNVTGVLGKGGTAPVFEIGSPDGPRALKIYDHKFSTGELGEIESKRITEQLKLSGHGCQSLVQVYEGGDFEGRLFLLMNRAPGAELEGVLTKVPRKRIGFIVDQVARAALFLAAKGYCHRDIKAANIFVTSDWSRVTLLDVSVIKEIYDPIGLGTDHNGQLPVLATARYSPPEYLFRLLEPSPALWHSLTVYQLGALIHDLVMQKPLFDEEYKASSSNRYRFAWIVATANPVVSASDVDQDLVFLAKRALDKDWKQRSTVKTEDFLADANIHMKRSLGLIGFGVEVMQSASTPGVLVSRIRDIAKEFERLFADRLRVEHILSKHATVAGKSDLSQTVNFTWDFLGPLSSSKRVEFSVSIEALSVLDGELKLFARLSTSEGAQSRVSTVSMTNIRLDSDSPAVLAVQSELALRQLCKDISGPYENPEA